MGVAACIICYNEMILLPSCIKYVDSLKNITEISVVDSFSTDGTWEFLNTYKFSKPVYLSQCMFDSFSKQRQRALDACICDWALTIDADETFTMQLDGLLWDLENKPSLGRINAVRVPTIIIYPDRLHYLTNIHELWIGADPHVKLWKRSFAKYDFSRPVHEWALTPDGRNLHTANGPDILNAFQGGYPDVHVKHAQLLKGQAGLLKKGDRWQELGLFELSAQAGIPVYREWWAEAEMRIKSWPAYVVVELPEKWYDVTTKGQI
jgi:glycosyltransferase involved in cell wall biosynthesis